MKWVQDGLIRLKVVLHNKQNNVEVCFLNPDFSFYSPSRALEFSRMLNSIGTDILVLQEIFEEIINGYERSCLWRKNRPWDYEDFSSKAREINKKGLVENAEKENIE